MAANGSANILRLLDARTGEVLRDWKLDADAGGLAFDFSPTADRLAADSGSGNITQWRPSDGALLGVFQAFVPTSLSLSGLRYSPNGDRLLAFDTGSQLRLFAVSNGQMLDEHELAGVSFIRDAHFTPDGTHVLITGSDDQTRVYHPANQRVLHQIPSRGVLGFSADGFEVITITRDGELNTWRLSDGTRSATRQLPIADFSAALSPDARVLLVSQNNRRVLTAWDASSGRLLAELQGEPGHRLISMARGGDGATLFAGRLDGTVLAFELPHFLSISRNGHRVQIVTLGVHGEFQLETREFVDANWLPTGRPFDHSTTQILEPSGSHLFRARRVGPGRAVAP